MDSWTGTPSTTRTRRTLVLLLIAVCVLVPDQAGAQGVTGALIGTVRDGQGGVLRDAAVRISSPALIGGPVTETTNEKGQLRFPVLLPGVYVLDIEVQGFTSYHEEDIRIGAGATIERTVVLKLAGLAESVVVEGAGSRIEARNPGFGTRFGPEDFKAIPTRRSSMFDLMRAAPGVSPTSPSSGITTTISAFGSGTNENQFLIDGTNFTCPCNGIARAEPGVDFIQEVQVQAVGASAEFGNVQGAVVNVVTRQGSAVVLRRLPVFARLRQPAGHRSGIPEDLRTGQDLREAHVEAGAGLAADAERSREALGEPGAADAREAVPDDAARARLGTCRDLRLSDAHRVEQHAVGSARRTVRLLASG